MLDLKALKDNGINMSYTTMIQMFKAMMEDRDTMNVKEWMSRYSGYLLDTATAIMKANDIEDFTEEDCMKFASHIAQSVYSKEYDDMVDDIDMSEMTDFIKASEGKQIAKS